MDIFQVFVEEFKDIDETNIIDFLNLCVDYIYASVDMVKSNVYTMDHFSSFTYTVALRTYINPMIEKHSDKLGINKFDCFFMLENRNITSYVYKLLPIIATSHYEKMLLSLCLDLTDAYEEAKENVLNWFACSTINVDYEKVDNELCRYLSEDFPKKKKKALFERDLDPIEGTETYNRARIENMLIVDMGSECIRKMNKHK